ncbi:MAG: PKD domain-containing protein, partial [Thiohalomonadales bacterium]
METSHTIFPALIGNQSARDRHYISKLIRYLATTVLIFSLIGCSDPTPSDPNADKGTTKVTPFDEEKTAIAINEAELDSDKEILHVLGRYNSDFTPPTPSPTPPAVQAFDDSSSSSNMVTINLYDSADLNLPLGSRDIDTDKSKWNFEIALADLAYIPCAVTVVVDDMVGMEGYFDAATVSDLPDAGCGNPGNTPPVAPTPIAAITINTSQMIQIGDVVDFMAGTSSDPNNLTLTYAWQFEGGTPSTSTLIMEPVTFNTAGIFNASLIVTNSQNMASVPDTMMITVMDPTIPPPANQIPVAVIVPPTAPIETGAAVMFMGDTSNDPDGNTPLIYNWQIQTSG